MVSKKAFFLRRLAWIVVDWIGQYIAITDENFLMIGGPLTRTVTAIPLDDVSGLTFGRSPAGLLMGYGVFRIGFGEAGPLSIDYVPYPEQLYLRLREAIQAAKAGGGPAPDGGVPGGEDEVAGGGGGGVAVAPVASEPRETHDQPGVRLD